MKKIIITATAESIEQVEELLEANVDRIYVGEKNYGLRLPHNFSLDELTRISDLVHQAGKELTVAVNALMHQEMMDNIKPYLDFLQEIGADYITVGDAGVFYMLQRDGYKLKTIYDASTMVTSSRQINFWAKNAGVSEAVLAREIPSAELLRCQRFWKFLLKSWFTELVSSITPSVLFCRITIILLISMMRRRENGTSFWRNQAIHRAITRFLRTIMVLIFLPIMTWI